MDNKWAKFNHFFKWLEIPAKTVLLQEGQISKRMFFIEKGCLRTWVNKVIKAPFHDAFKVLGVDYSAASTRFGTHGISIKGAATIEEIWLNNDLDPEKVIDLITE